VSSTVYFPLSAPHTLLLMSKLWSWSGIIRENIARSAAWSSNLSVMCNVAAIECMVNPLTHTELCHMGTARPINHPVPDRVKPSFVTMTFDGQP